MKVYNLAILFVYNIQKLHGLPNSIISDRGPLFVSEFWKAVCYCLQINISLSIVYHLETDSQTENANLFLEQYLCQYISFVQDNQDEQLLLAEFAACNVINDLTGMSLFLVNTGYYPRISFSPPRLVLHTVSKDLVECNTKGNDFTAKMQEITKLLYTNLLLA